MARTRTYILIRRKWRVKKSTMFWLFIPELLLTVTCLVLFGLQQADLFRSLFWEIGHQYRFNSDPRMILYAYANHRPLPSIPFVWSRTLTDFNAAISILSLFIMLARLIAVIMRVYYPIIGTFTAVTMTVLYTVSVYGQAGPDYADPRYPSPVPWYIRHSCRLAEPFHAVAYCQMAKGTFAATVLFLILYVLHSVLAGWSMWPNKELDLPDEDDEDAVKAEKSYEMRPPLMAARAYTPSGIVPFTPRTQASHTLDRTLDRESPLLTTYPQE